MSRIPGMDIETAVCECGSSIMVKPDRSCACIASCGRDWSLSIRDKVIRTPATVADPAHPLNAPVDLEKYAPGGNVVRLVDEAEGQPAPDMRAWLQSWVDSPGLDPGVRSVVLLVEGPDGTLGQVMQSIVPSDGRRTAGLLAEAQHRLLHGKPQGLV